MEQFELTEVVERYLTGEMGPEEKYASPMPDYGKAMYMTLQSRGKLQIIRRVEA
jgi:hypothetical protein